MPAKISIEKAPKKKAKTNGANGNGHAHAAEPGGAALHVHANGGTQVFVGEQITISEAFTSGSAPAPEEVFR